MRTYLTIPKALEQYPKLDKPTLDRLIDEGKITTFMLNDVQNSQQIVYDDDIASYFADKNITPEQFENLKGSLIGINEAASKYSIASATLSGWLKQGVLKCERAEKNRKLVDEAAVAYLVNLSRAKKIRAGKKLFN
jgi:hypothetical protein